MSETYYDAMFNLGGAAVTSLTSMNAGTTASAGAYSPKADGFLQTISIFLNGQAASSLAQQGYVQFTCTKWAPVNTLTIPLSGFGLLTAPQLYGGNQAIATWPVNLPVSTAVPINGSVIYLYSPVTPAIYVMGGFLA